jgi:endonuclease/exonuclease/phosphatase family metal-dependent hydrolase
MLKPFLSAVVFLTILSASTAQNINVATYNLRYDNPHDSLDLWKNRYTKVADLIRFYNFDIFGTQEGLKHQLEDLKKVLPAYDYIGVGRTDGKDAGEFAAIYYKTSQFKLEQQGTFWLAPTTDKPNIGWDAALPRVCTWGRFTEKSSKLRFYIFNVHFDHRGIEARKESARLILEKIKEIAGKNPVILTGDFNVDENNESYLLLKNSVMLRDAYDIAAVKLAHTGTFNGFNVNSKSTGRIDHIFLSAGFEVQRYGILTNTYNGRYPSDHFPVVAKIKYKK